MGWSEGGDGVWGDKDLHLVGRQPCDEKMWFGEKNTGLRVRKLKRTSQACAPLAL